MPRYCYLEPMHFRSCSDALESAPFTGMLAQKPAATRRPKAHLSPLRPQIQGKKSP
jgi:hypothetical protein